MQPRIIFNVFKIVQTGADLLNTPFTFKLSLEKNRTFNTGFSVLRFESVLFCLHIVLKENYFCRQVQSVYTGWTKS